MEEKKDKKYPMVPSEYKLLEEVGQGVSGYVYRACCLPFNECVAVKQLDLEKCNGTLDNVRKEAQTMTLINHPNVVRAHCSFVVRQHLWVVMPYMGGGSCLHIMKAAFPDGFEEPVIATILRDTLKALEYLHRQGHIHRDVKAGNILVDECGGVKLGDFGVAACMFDTGDRQWSRNTFVGTPCWMAPEVMEQLNGYDFKADIWSFGITALELAHGHAPFSKYPPMKVLLMTLQNAPPGLTYERDKRFSKSFKEMIAMCLVKDPTKRPTAEKLLKHSFFKNAKSADYIAKNVLDGLPPLWERVRNVKLRDAARLAEKKMPYGEQEERSQNEYKRGVSGWNFDVEDLKAQAALIQDDEYAPVHKKDEEASPYRGGETISRVASSFLSGDENHHASEHSKADMSPEGEEGPIRTTSLPCPKPLNGAKTKGRFNVFMDNVEVDASNWSESSEHKEECGSADMPTSHKDERCEDREIADDRDFRLVNGNDREKEIDGSEHPVSASSKEDDRDLRQSLRTGDEHPRTTQERGNPDHRPANGSARPPAGPKDEVKGHVVQKKGRFSVTSADVELKDPKENKDGGNLPSVKVKSNSNSDHGGDGLLSPPSLKKGAASQQPSGTATPTIGSSPAPVQASAILPQLQTLLNQTAMQQDMIVTLMSNVCNAEIPGSGTQSQRLTRTVSANAVDHHAGEAWSDRERELRQQIAELQGRVGALVDELHAVKIRNVQLERQLNTIFNKEEEERIRKEDAAKEDG